jgi:hypothetical protein
MSASKFTLTPNILAVVIGVVAGQERQNIVPIMDKERKKNQASIQFSIVNRSQAVLEHSAPMTSTMTPPVLSLFAITTI